MEGEEEVTDYQQTNQPTVQAPPTVKDTCIHTFIHTYIKRVAPGDFHRQPQQRQDERHQ